MSRLAISANRLPGAVARTVASMKPLIGQAVEHDIDARAPVSARIWSAKSVVRES